MMMALPGRSKSKFSSGSLPFFGFCSINMCIGIIQEVSPENSANAFKAMMSSDAQVIRDGNIVKVTGDQIVPGAIVQLSWVTVCPPICK
jgi:magnesium-transporting ATPase (P-type)